MSGADFLTVCDTLLIADDAVSVREAQRALCDLIATHSYFVIVDEHDVVCPLFHQRHRDPGTGGPRAITRLVEALESVLERNATSAASEASRLSPAERVALLVPGSPGGVPRRIEWLGPGLLLLPHDALTHPAWLDTLTSYVRHGDLRDSRHGDADGQSNDVRAVDAECVTVHRSAEVWDVVANVFGADRVARAARVDAGCTRRSRVEMLKSVSEPGAWQLPNLSVGEGSTQLRTSGAEHSFSDNIVLNACDSLMHDGVLTVPANLNLRSGGWTRIVESGVVYAFDATRNMFSSGNVTEKARMGRLEARGQVIVDLFAGIGYYVLPLLLKAGAAHVHACDINPDAIATLRINLALNGITPGQCTVWPGDNQTLLQCSRRLGVDVARTADRVLLGLLPSSATAWPLAVACLKDEGGTLHVHGNATAGAEQAWGEEVAAAVRAIAQSTGRTGWNVTLSHVERVKSYAPRVVHVVADIVVTR